MNIYITVWDSDAMSEDNLPLQFDMVDEYSIDFTDAPGSSSRVIVANGLRTVEPTRYV